MEQHGQPSAQNGLERTSELYLPEKALHEELTRNVNLYNQQCKAFMLLRKLRSENDALLDAINILEPSLAQNAPVIDKRSEKERHDAKPDIIDWTQFFDALYS